MPEPGDVSHRKGKKEGYGTEKQRRKKRKNGLSLDRASLDLKTFSMSRTPRK